MKLALTYDDGPEPPWTEQMLDVLAEYDAPATFFVMARRAITHRHLIARMAAEGHEIGFHCLEHTRHSEMTAEEVAADTEMGLDLLASIGVVPSIWRAPWGVVTDATLDVAWDHGLALCGWNFDSHDWRGDSRAEMVDALERQGGLRDGTIALMHDGLGPGVRRNGCEETVRLTSTLLDLGADSAFTPVTVSDVLTPAPVGDPAR